MIKPSKYSKVKKYNLKNSFVLKSASFINLLNSLFVRNKNKILIYHKKFPLLYLIFAQLQFYIFINYIVSFIYFHESALRDSRVRRALALPRSEENRSYVSSVIAFS